MTRAPRRFQRMVLPRWTRSPSQAMFIDDVVEVLAHAAVEPEFLGRTLDLVNGESLDYETILRQMAASLGLTRTMLRVPIASAGFSKLWVQIFGNASRELVSPLIDSLLCALPQMLPAEPIARLIRYPTFQGMLTTTLSREAPVSLPPGRSPPSARTVRSTQRLPPLPTRDARWIGYRAAALVFTALHVWGEYPADASDYDATAVEHLRLALALLALGFGNLQILGGDNRQF